MALSALFVLCVGNSPNKGLVIKPEEAVEQTVNVCLLTQDTIA